MPSVERCYEAMRLAAFTGLGIGIGAAWAALPNDHLSVAAAGAALFILGIIGRDVGR